MEEIQIGRGTAIGCSEERCRAFGGEMISRHFHREYHGDRRRSGDPAVRPRRTQRGRLKTAVAPGLR